MNAAHIIALYAHTAAITNARNDYHARPTRACHGHDYASRPCRVKRNRGAA